MLIKFGTRQFYLQINVYKNDSFSWLVWTSNVGDKK